MKKIIILSALFLFNVVCFSQDTIVKNNGTQIRAKISEITPTEIKYKKFDFIDGPTYTERKSDVQMIKYSNGIRDYFESQPQQTNEYYQPNDRYQKKEEVYVPKPDPDKNKILIKGPFYKYNYNYIKEPEVHLILLKTKDIKITALVAESRKARNISFIGFAAFPLFLAGVYLGYDGDNRANHKNGYAANSTKNASVSFTGAALCGVLAIACPITSGIFKMKRTAATREAIMLYNEKY